MTVVNDRDFAERLEREDGSVHAGNSSGIVDGAAAVLIGDRVPACGAHHLDWPIGRKRLKTLRYIRRIADWFDAERPDIVHVHSRLPAWICWRATCT